jgi:hypothetical protein
MPDIYLDVPYVSQMKIGGHAGPGHDEITGCWYASTCMLGYYREAGPRLGVPALYATPGPTGNPNPKPISPDTFPVLAQNEGLTPIPLPADKKWTCEKLAEILRECGPCLVGRGFRVGAELKGGHIIVVVGARTSDNLVIIHDPAVGPNLTLPIDGFNNVFPWDRPEAKWLMMVKLPPLANGEQRGRANAMSDSPPTRPRSNAFSH